MPFSIVVAGGQLAEGFVPAVLPVMETLLIVEDGLTARDALSELL
jgi:hypothetical protein